VDAPEKGNTMTMNETTAPETVREADVAAADSLPTEATAAEAPAVEASDATAAEAPDAEASDAVADADATTRQRSVSVSVRGLAVGAVISVLAAAVAVLGWLYFGAHQERNAQIAELNNNAHAEKIALDYAVNAATMDFKDLQAWHVKLVAGTSPELNKKLSDAGTSMEQVLVPLQWTSAAQPLVAKVRSSKGGIYVVDSFVSVQTKTIQSPDPLQSTATYSTTIDSNNNWQITDVGGIGSAMAAK
jgi:Mce-associated membrane protein